MFSIYINYGKTPLCDHWPVWWSHLFCSTSGVFQSASQTKAMGDRKIFLPKSVMLLSPRIFCKSSLSSPCKGYRAFIHGRTHYFNPKIDIVRCCNGENNHISARIIHWWSADFCALPHTEVRNTWAGERARLSKGARKFIDNVRIVWYTGAWNNDARSMVRSKPMGSQHVNKLHCSD